MWVPINPGCIGLSRSPAEVRAIIPLVFHEDNVAFYVTAFVQNLLIGAAPGLPCVEPSKLLPSREGGTRWIGAEGRWALNTTEVHQFRGPGFPAGSVWFCTDLRSLLISLVKDDSNIAVHFYFMQPVLNFSNPILCKPGEREMLLLIVALSLSRFPWLCLLPWLLCVLGSLKSFFSNVVVMQDNQMVSKTHPVSEGFLLLAEQP